LKLNIEELKNSPEGTKEIYFNEKVDELENDFPVEASLTAKTKACGINIKGNVNTKLKLVCDRCSEEYVYSINVKVDEDFVTDSFINANQKEYELNPSQFVEELQGRDEIDINDFLYQTVILEVPFKKICDESCQGSEALQKAISEKFVDERLEVFKTFSENNYID